MPRRYEKGGESRLSLEGLMGQEFDGKVIRSIVPHGDPRRTRLVTFEDGSTKSYTIRRLLDALIKSKE